MKLSLRQKEVSINVHRFTNLLKDLSDIVSQYVYHGSFKMKPVLGSKRYTILPIFLQSYLYHNERLIEWQRIAIIGGYLMQIVQDIDRKPVTITITPETGPLVFEPIGLFSGETEDEIWLFQEKMVIVFSATTLLKLRTVDCPFLNPKRQQFYSIQEENILFVEYEGEFTIFE